MPHKSKPPGNYEVGYGRPPTQTRFKPGQSGNQKGRPRGARDVKTLMEEALRQEFLEKVTVVEGGKSRVLTKLQVMVKTNANKAVKGEARALRELLALAHRVGVFEGLPSGADAVPATLPFSAEDQAIVDRFLARERGREPSANTNTACSDPNHTSNPKDDAA